MQPQFCGWLKGMPFGTSTRTWADPSKRVPVLLELIQYFEGIEDDSLENAVCDFEAPDSMTRWVTEGPAANRSSVEEILSHLVRVIEMATKAVYGSSSVDWETHLESSGVSGSDINWAREAVDGNLAFIREKSDLLCSVINDLTDPRGSQMPLLLDRLERHASELRARMAMAATQ